MAMPSPRVMAISGAATAVAAGAVALALLAGDPEGTRSSAAAQAAPEPSAAVARPIDPAQQRAVDFGTRSHWVQPWRAYLDTPTTRRFRQAVGINLNVEPAEVAATARLVAASGFRRARVEVGWSAMSYARPDRLRQPARLRGTVRALRRNGLRPLILLNANDSRPGPSLRLKVRLAAPAVEGARQVRLDPGDAARMVPGRSGLDGGNVAAEAIFTSIAADGTATLSRPLPRALDAGAHDATVLRYEPFSHPASPRFAQTLEGWRAYVRAVTSGVRATLGSAAFDVEVWNELSFGADFLDINRYYEPDIEEGDDEATQRAILEATIAEIRAPGRGLAGVGIGDGFANQRPWDAGSTSPPGLTALDKHPYPPRRVFPADAAIDGVRPLDALGRPEGTQGADGNWTDAFIPAYTANFPEYSLTAIQTEHLVRDLSPFPSEIYDTLHGRGTSAPGGRPLQMWLTEINTIAEDARGAAKERVLAKASLRTLVAYVNKGASAVHLYAVRDGEGDHRLVATRFFDLLAPRDGNRYPGDAAGGRIMAAVRRLVAEMPAGRVTDRRALSVERIGDFAGRRQFEGDGSAAHPPLYDRDVTAVLPFQVSDREFAVAVYVMTRDVEAIERAALGAGAPARYDRAPARYRLTLSGVRGCDIALTARDPLLDRAVPVRQVGCEGGTVILDMDVTDSPRILHIVEGR